MKENTLLDKGIILPTGEINKNKINLVAGAITQPFTEMVWVTTGGDMETINRLTDILVTMHTPADNEQLFKILQMLYGLLGLQFNEGSRRYCAPSISDGDSRRDNRAAQSHRPNEVGRFNEYRQDTGRGNYICRVDLQLVTLQAHKAKLYDKMILDVL